jgi:glycosyltransferase involved in cell wall biosynthesis
MFRNQRVVVVMPAYNATRTLLQTHREVLAQENIVDEVIVVDDAGSDDTYSVAATLPQTTAIRHDKNRGYGGNQKTCYRTALDRGADIVIMVHPDYQYTPMLIPAMASLVANGVYHCVLGSRILGGQALAGGMPWWKYVANRFLTAVENVLLGAKLSEYHTGYRAFSRELLLRVPFENNSDDFVFDNQMLAQIHWLGYTIAEVTCPTRYFKEASSINFRRSCRYGLGCLGVAAHYRLARWGLVSDSFYREAARPDSAGAASATAGSTTAPGDDS